MPAGKRAYGSLFKMGGTTIAKVVSIGEIGPSCEGIDSTNLDSEDATVERIDGLVDYGQCQIGLNFIPGNSGQQSLRALVGSTPDPATTFSIVWTDSGETWSWRARVQDFKASGEVKGKLDAKVTVDIVSKITVT